ncbi:hypothetical protein [Nocardiopsis protaetiae]|uniref:hypothetical protein n=1 Tax=Nocardiopsis protaetiae TaxID=3382270 RepID=UPI00387B8271
METPETRRAAGALIQRARREAGISQRALAREAGISETWFRAMTVGLRGEDPQRANDDVWAKLAFVVGLPPERVFAELGREVGEDDPMPDPGDRYETERVAWLGGRVARIARDLAEQTRDLPPEAAAEIVRRALDGAAEQALLRVDAERHRWEREQQAGEVEDET